jgi:serine/threonine-protein kinase RIO1
MTYIEAEKVRRRIDWMSHIPLILDALRVNGLRHGDLTAYSIIPFNNHPHIIDWSESRTWDDPRPDKRREGDAHWLRIAMKDLANGQWTVHQRS